METRLILKNNMKRKRYLVKCKGKEFASVLHVASFFNLSSFTIYNKISKWIKSTKTDLTKPVVSTTIKVKDRTKSKEYKIYIKIQNEEYAEKATGIPDTIE